MRLTARCNDLLRLLRNARWLTTAQIHRRFFARATSDAVRRRLRKLTATGYLFRVQRDRMSQALFTLGPEGKRTLEKSGIETVLLERRPPTQLEHFTAINDIRIAAELAGELRYLYAAWELPGVGWRYRLIPDAVFALGTGTYALEFDRGVEGIRFFIRTKVSEYERGLEGFPLTAVLVVTDRAARMISLAKAIGDQHGRMLFSTLELVVEHGLLAPVFDAAPSRTGLRLLGEPLLSASPAAERVCAEQYLAYE